VQHSDKLPRPARGVDSGGRFGLSPYEDAAGDLRLCVAPSKPRQPGAIETQRLLYVEGAEDFGPDETVRAVIGGSGS